MRLSSLDSQTGATFHICAVKWQPASYVTFAVSVDVEMLAEWQLIWHHNNATLNWRIYMCYFFTLPDTIRRSIPCSQRKDVCRTFERTSWAVSRVQLAQCWCPHRMRSWTHDPRGPSGPSGPHSPPRSPPRSPHSLTWPLAWKTYSSLRYSSPSVNRWTRT